MPGGMGVFLRKAARYGVPGAVAGGVTGYETADGDFWDRLKAAAIGAGGGFAAGAALGPGGEFVGKAAREIPHMAAGLAGIPGNEGRAALEIGKALHQSGLTAEEVAQRVADARARGVPLSPIDVSLPLRGLGESIASLPNEASSTIVHHLTDRQLGQPSRVLGHIREALGNDADMMGAAERIIGERSAEAAPLYERAYAGTALSDALDALMPRLQASGALGRASRIAEIEGQPFGNLPSMKSWDYIKRGLDDQIESYRDPTTGKLVLDDHGRALVGLRGELLDALDAANPDYAAARAAYAGHSEMLDALHLGRRFLRGDQELTQSQFDALSPAEQQMFRIGAARELKARVDQSQDGANVVRRIFGSQDRRDKMRILFPDQTSFDAFSELMSMENETALTRNQVTANSRTAQRIAGQSELMADAAVDMIVRGRPTGWVTHMLTSLLYRTRGLDDPTANAIANYLLNGELNARQMDRVNRIIQSERNAGRLTGNLTALGAGAAAGAFSGDLNSEPQFMPVDQNPFNIKLTPVDHDPFAVQPPGIGGWMNGSQGP